MSQSFIWSLFDIDESDETKASRGGKNSKVTRKRPAWLSLDIYEKNILLTEVVVGPQRDFFFSLFQNYISPAILEKKENENFLSLTF